MGDHRNVRWRAFLWVSLCRPAKVLLHCSFVGSYGVRGSEYMRWQVKLRQIKELPNFLVRFLMGFLVSLGWLRNLQLLVLGKGMVVYVRATPRSILWRGNRICFISSQVLGFVVVGEVDVINSLYSTPLQPIQSIMNTSAGSRIDDISVWLLAIILMIIVLLVGNLLFDICHMGLCFGIEFRKIIRLYFIYILIKWDTGMMLFSAIKAIRVRFSLLPVYVTSSVSFPVGVKKR